MNNYTGFVYFWFDRHKKLYCLGSHMGTTEDNYTSSTGIFSRAYNKRPQDFKRRIIYYHNGNRQSLYEKEQYYLNMIKPEELYSNTNKKSETVRYYNQNPLARGISGEYASELRKEYFKTERGLKWKEILSERMKNNNPCKKGNIPWNKGIECPSIVEGRKTGKKPEYNEKRLKSISVRTTKLWNDGVFDNRPSPSPEHMENLRLNNIGRKQTDFQKQKAREANSRRWRIIHPDNTEEIIINLNEFCRQHKLDQGNMIKVSTGILRQHKRFRIEKLENINTL